MRCCAERAVAWMPPQLKTGLQELLESVTRGDLELRLAEAEAEALREAGKQEKQLELEFIEFLVVAVEPGTTNKAIKPPGFELRMRKAQWS